MCDRLSSCAEEFRGPELSFNWPRDLLVIHTGPQNVKGNGRGSAGTAIVHAGL